MKTITTTTKTITIRESKFDPFPSHSNAMHLFFPRAFCDRHGEYQNAVGKVVRHKQQQKNVSIKDGKESVLFFPQHDVYGDECDINTKVQRISH